MQFEIIGEIYRVETVAVDKSVRILSVLHKRYGKGAVAKVEKHSIHIRLFDGSVRIAEVHWFEAHGIGRRKMRIKQFLD